jgi:hypothetical protein
MKVFLWMTLLGFTFAAYAQKQTDWAHVNEKMSSLRQSDVRDIDQLSRYINENFATDTDKLKAIYFWLGTNINYDLSSLNRPQKQQSREEIILSTFKNRKGVCEGYAGIMDTLCKLSGIPVYTIHGFTKQQQRIEPLPHAWIAAQVDGEWFLFDPTFASGSLINNRFVREFDPNWFKVRANKMIETHMPYDHIWQFLNAPVSYRSFATDHLGFDLYDKPFYYRDSINHHLQLPPKEKLKHERRRIQMNEFAHPVVKLRIDYLSEALKVNENNTQIETFNRATQAYNDAAKWYNSYARMRNHHRLDDRSAAQLSNLLVDALTELDKATSLLRQINRPPADMAKHIRSLNQSIDQLRKQVNSEMRAIGSRR